MYQLLSRVSHIQYQRAFVWLECVAIVTLFALYMYFVVVSVAQVVLRKELVFSIQQTEAQVSELEATYLAQLSSLSPDMLPEYDLVAVAPTGYISVTQGDRLTRRQ